MYMAKSYISEVVIPVILIYSVQGAIFGFVGHIILKDKGYRGEDNRGFLWGFFLSFLGLIVCACKPNYINTVEGQKRIDRPSSNNYRSQASNNAEELISLKKLFDCGAITEEEYNAKKKQILGL
ncbi:MAG: SHOCT domain-containing protein [Ruminococcus sp.]|nr:SHOCT domain-containing protein [Ruminococcus sp.]